MVAGGPRAPAVVGGSRTGAPLGGPRATAVAPLGSPVAVGVRPPPVVVPGVGPVHPGHVMAATSALVQPLVHQTLVQPNANPKLVAIARQGPRRSPRATAAISCFGNTTPPGYRLPVARVGRLPSQVWTASPGAPIAGGTLGERLSGAHRPDGKVLERDHGHRPLAERALIGLAAPAGAHEEVVQAIDAGAARARAFRRGRPSRVSCMACRRPTSRTS